MARNITFNGVVYTIPDVGDDSWGLNLTNYFVAIPQGVLQKSGGTFTLSGEVDFGASYGLVLAYLKTRGVNPAATGLIRLNVADFLAWRNNANSADLTLAINGSDQLTFNGNAIYPLGITALTGDVTATGPGSVAATIGAGKVTNAMLAGSIAYSKLSLTGAILNADLAAAVSIAKGGTGQATQTLGFNALAPSTTKGDIIVHDGTNNVRQGIGTDGQVLLGDSTQPNGLKWATLQQGAKNYITFNNFENNSTTGWSLGTATLTSALPTGAPTFGSGASGNLSIATVSSGQLAGTYSLSYVSSAATTAGNFVASQAYTIDKEDQAKVLSFKFYYSPTVNPTNGNWSGTSSNSLGVAIYDVTNSAWIIPAGCFNLVQSTGVGIAQGTFQTPSNMTQFRIVVYNANATSGSITVLLDDFYVGPQSLAFGPPVGDWTSGTLTITGSTSNPTPGTNSSFYFYRRVGDSVEVTFGFQQTGAGSAGSGTYRFNLPTGLTIDTSKLTSTFAATTLGSAYILNGSGEFVGTVRYDTATALNLSYESAVGTVANVGSANSSLAGTTIRFAAKFIVPISGWSSNTVQSADTDVRPCGANYTGNPPTGTLGASFNITTFPTKVSDTHASYSSGSYTIPITGLWNIAAMVDVNATFSGVTQYVGISIFIDGAEQYTNYVQANAASTTDYVAPIAVNNIPLNAGQLVSIRTKTGASSPTYISRASTNYFSISRSSGPSVVSSSEIVTCRYTNTAGSSLGTSDQNIPFATRSYDTHSAFNGTVFTAPISGKFRMTYNFVTAGVSMTTTQGVSAGYRKNATTVRPLVNYGAGVSRQMTVNFSAEIDLLAGETLEARGTSDVATTLDTTAGWNALTITKIG